MTTVLRESVIALAELIGFRTAKKWNAEKMQGKLEDIAKLPMDEDDMEEWDDTSKKLYKLIVKEKGMVEVVEYEDELDAPKPANPKSKKKEEVVEAEDEPEFDDDEDDDTDDDEEEEEVDEMDNDEDDVEEDDSDDEFEFEEEEADEDDDTDDDDTDDDEDEEEEDESDAGDDSVDDSDEDESKTAEELNAEIRKMVPDKKDKTKKKRGPTIHREPPKPKPEAKRCSPAKGKLGAKKNWLYYAGRLIAKYGVDAGVTAEMVDKLDKMREASNKKQSRWLLTTAWSAVVGYVGME